MGAFLDSCVCIRKSVFDGDGQCVCCMTNALSLQILWPLASLFPPPVQPEETLTDFCLA